MALRESGENYLETILMLEEKLGKARSVDVAAQCGYSRASVSRGVSILKKEGLLEIAADGTLELTKKGRERASGIYERHKVIADFLSEILGVNKQTALEDACRIEHILSEESFAKMKEKIASKQHHKR